MIPGILFLFAGLGTFVCYERLVRRQYKVSWEADGRPPGFLWSPPESSVMRSWTRGKVYFRWIVSTPAWIAHDNFAYRLQQLLRILWLIAVGAWAWLVAILFLGH
jgi:hypothetical protein